MDITEIESDINTRNFKDSIEKRTAQCVHDRRTSGSFGIPCVNQSRVRTPLVSCEHVHYCRDEASSPISPVPCMHDGSNRFGVGTYHSDSSFRYSAEPLVSRVCTLNRGFAFLETLYLPLTTCVHDGSGGRKSEASQASSQNIGFGYLACVCTALGEFLGLGLGWQNGR